MAYTTKVVVFLCTLVFLQVSCAVSQLTNVPAWMTADGLEKGEGGGGPAACDGSYHRDQEYMVSLSTKWYAGGARCGKLIRRTAPSALNDVTAMVIDECRGCNNKVGASPAVWNYLGLHTSSSEVGITWSDIS